MNAEMKKKIGLRIRRKREEAGYSREALGELCSLSPRFIANIEFGDSTCSLDSLINICRTLACSSDELIFGGSIDETAWGDVISRIKNMDVQYHDQVENMLQCILETISKAERRP